MTINPREVRQTREVRPDRWWSAEGGPWYRSSMKLLVLGATGDIGEAVLKAAITAGHDVTAFVRSPDKLGEVRDRVESRQR